MAKLLLVIDCLGSGGAQRQLVSLAKAFVKLGHQVEMFTYFPKLNHFEKDIKDVGITLHYGEKSHRFSLAPVFSLSRIIRQGRYDGILSFLRNPAIYCEWAYIFARFMGGKKSQLVFSERLNYFEFEKRSFLFRFAQQSHRICDAVVANNHFQRKEMQAIFPWMKLKLHTIYNGLDVAKFNVTEPAIQKSTSLLTIARVVEYKNYENLALALVEYQKSWGKPPFIKWVGKVFETPANLALFNKVQALLEKHNLKENLQFLGEQLDVTQYYKQADALIHSSKIEGFSNVVIEASEYGLPLLLGNIGDHQLLMDNYQAGLIFDVNDPKSIANAIRQFVDANAKEKNLWREQAILARKNLFRLEDAANAYLKLLLARN